MGIIISRVNKAASVLKMSSRSKRMVQAALSQPSEDINFSEIEDSEISDTDSNSIPPDDLGSNISEFSSIDLSPLVPQNKEPTEFILCKFSMGYYSQKCLRRHAKHCFFNPDPAKPFNAESEGQTVMAGHFGPNDILRSSGLLSMLRADEVSMVAKKDPIICDVARRDIRRHKEKHLLLVEKEKCGVWLDY
ncbi:hypothetical protein JTB14_011727 [Gonioctena quinquepunctata]|nr:hypothetical protein JTB14_011727 [Gonioctena quinquepunctata]